ncbi:MAG: MFS transporter, partial [Acidimicrobiales bacterium]
MLDEGDPVAEVPAGVQAGVHSGAPGAGGRAKLRNPLAIRAFRLLWINNVAFFLVANAERFVFGWLVLDYLDRGEREQGMVVFALGIPAVFVTLHAGVWADRYDRRKILIATQLAGAAAMTTTGLLIASGRADVSLTMAAAVLA